jgi:hypothetical protein
MIQSSFSEVSWIRLLTRQHRVLLIGLPNAGQLGSVCEISRIRGSAEGRDIHLYTSTTSDRGGDVQKHLAGVLLSATVSTVDA